MSVAEYDLDEYSIEETDNGYAVVEVPDSGEAEIILEEFEEQYGSSSYGAGVLPFDITVVATSSLRPFSGVVHLGGDTIIATGDASDDLVETTEEVLNP